MPPRLLSFVLVIVSCLAAGCLATARTSPNGRYGWAWEASCSETGWLITGFKEDSAASAAGILEGDRIIAIAGVEVGMAETSLDHPIWNRRPGETVVVTVLRGASLLQFPVVLGPGGLVWGTDVGIECPGPRP